MSRVYFSSAWFLPSQNSISVGGGGGGSFWLHLGFGVSGCGLNWALMTAATLARAFSQVRPLELGNQVANSFGL